MSDGQAESQPAAVVNVTVKNVNHAPSASAGPDQRVKQGIVVTLNGSASFDPDSDPLTFHWAQVAGTPVDLSTPDAADASFTAPFISQTREVLTFEITVSDGLESSTDHARHHRDGDDDDCGDDQPRVSIVITKVTQDEPVSGLGDGDTSPDAIIEGSTVLIRAERDGRGNGGVYKITFKAIDREGRECIGVVTVTVPHDRHRPAIDDGQRYDSTRRSGSRR